MATSWPGKEKMFNLVILREEKSNEEIGGG
jgi:hypothetical protein